MPLYMAETEITVFFVADDDKAAQRQADGYLRDEVQWNGVQAMDVRRATRSCVGADWLNSAPYGAPDTTVKAVLEAMEAAPPTPAELEAAGQARIEFSAGVSR